MSTIMCMQLNWKVLPLPNIGKSMTRVSPDVSTGRCRYWARANLRVHCVFFDEYFPKLSPELLNWLFTAGITRNVHLVIGDIT